MPNCNILSFANSEKSQVSENDVVCAVKCEVVEKWNKRAVKAYTEFPHAIKLLVCSKEN